MWIFAFKIDTLAYNSIMVKREIFLLRLNNVIKKQSKCKVIFWSSKNKTPEEYEIKNYFHSRFFNNTEVS